MSKNGCLAQIGGLFAGFLVLWLIEAFAGRPAAMWFAGGFLSAAVICFWEEGRAALSEGDG